MKTFYLSGLKNRLCLQWIHFLYVNWKGAYAYVLELWRKKQLDVPRFLLRVRCWDYCQLSPIVRVTRSTYPQQGLPFWLPGQASIYTYVYLLGFDFSGWNWKVRWLGLVSRASLYTFLGVHRYAVCTNTQLCNMLLLMIVVCVFGCQHWMICLLINTKDVYICYWKTFVRVLILTGFYF